VNHRTGKNTLVLIALRISPIWIDAEPALSEVDAIHPIDRLGLLRIPPFTFYDWHVDAYRQSCINMQLNLDHPSHTLFGYQADDHNKDVLELRYQPRTFYLFNNQIEHCVANLGGHALRVVTLLQKGNTF
jgi:hypothetical protein